jgi:rod shape-determining protein MreC
VAFPRRSSGSPGSRARFGLLVLTALSLLALDLPGTGPLRPIRNVLASAFQPVRSAGDAVLEPFSNGWKGAFGYDELKKENDRLRDELAKVVGQDADIERLEAKVRALEELNSIPSGEYPLRTAEVISAPLSNFDQSVEIDQGSGDGVKKGMAVVTSGNALFGRIESAAGGRSTVTLITTADFQVGVRLSDGTRAVAQGQGRGRPLLVDSVELVSGVEEGDWVYTSGVSASAFPKDIKIGKVTKIETVPGQGTTMEVEPVADLASVYVKVVLKDPPK